MLPGFPGYFQLTGANTGLGHTSMIHIIESQLAFIIDAIRKIEAAGGGPCVVRPDVAAAYNLRLQRKLPGTVWGSGCSSWYLDRDGPQPDPLARVHVPVPAPDPAVPAPRFHHRPARLAGQAAAARLARSGRAARRRLEPVLDLLLRRPLINRYWRVKLTARLARPS